ncbi:thiamine phosphate synthase [Pseudoflavonifractor sp. MSJ-37]|uniref:thiamine phosphate synthase n=1 Tax=Pseudoflavonifractor sp. MSJ-37 TaxID=2841531 RepID=UPI001C11F065|nr:thiamine phosphate synthase [Pseudoflavonifractor sp. MSJ-37]MBU5435599.1 thiamine phosphate synthase [Pseudoflavonifractor sp. MSJ-37]
MRFTKDEIRQSMLLYAVTDSSWLKPGETLPQVTEAVLANGATFLQIREKEMDHDAFLAEARALQAAAKRHHVPFVVNDAIDIALELDADGVHVGQSDIAGKDVRAMIGPDRILGISAGTVEEAVAAERSGADYIGVGAMFDTSTKAIQRTLSLEELRSICDAVSIPVVAIGGINARTILHLEGGGADGAAVVSAIFAQPDPGRATADLLALARRVFGRP